ncbi:hypothetical protein FA13DRAFT_1723068 [Coprinellus micaceus]|uniref:Uncharacterized protein n=1 Tax=Coprinellus micaceus TaxID=71717 RepID=A0A4Y7RC17_COPMI|nr:hypothetical protein FA13DRAFT_1723068 [Coprinellus micaceus]
MCAYGLTVFLETPKPGRQGRLPYIIINFVFLVLSGVSSFADLRYFFIATFYSTSPEDFIIKRESQNDWLGFAAGVLCVLTSLVGDGLMLYRCCVVWCDRRLIWGPPGAYLHRINRLGVADTTKTSSMYTGVLAILIESALPFTIIGIGYAIIMAVTQPYQDDVLKKEFANYVFSALYFSFAALSPQMIIFRVTTGRSWTGSLVRGPSDAGLSHGIVFARDLDNEGEDSQLSASDLEIVAGSSRDIQERELVEKT